MQLLYNGGLVVVYNIAIAILPFGKLVYQRKGLPPTCLCLCWQRLPPSDWRDSRYTAFWLLNNRPTKWCSFDLTVGLLRVGTCQTCRVHSSWLVSHFITGQSDLRVVQCQRDNMHAPNLPDSNPFSISSLLKPGPDSKDPTMESLPSMALAFNGFNGSSLNYGSSMAPLTLPPPYSIPMNLNIAKKDNLLQNCPQWTSSFLSMLPHENSFFDMYQSLLCTSNMDHSKVSSNANHSLVDSISIKYNLLKKCNLLLGNSVKCNAKSATSTQSDLVRGIFTFFKLITMIQASY